MLSLLPHAAYKMRRVAQTLLLVSCVVLSHTAVGRAQNVAVSSLFASDGAYTDWFGNCLAVSGENLLIAAPLDDIASKTNQGSVYLFGTSTGQQTRKMLALDGQVSDQFGVAMALQGSNALIGALGADLPGKTNQGAAYLFNFATGQQLFKITAPDGKANDQFGVAVELSEQRAIVGAYLADIGANVDQGCVYTFDPVTGQQLLKLTATDGAKGDQFGLSLSLSDNKLLIGAAGDDIGPNPDQGSAYIFDVYTGQQLLKLTASDGKANARFGISVALQGNLAMVGASLINQSNYAAEGSAYLYDATTGQQLAKLRASDGATGNLFGQSVALYGKYALIGARLDTIDNRKWQGSAYLFDISDPAHPVQVAKYIGYGGKASDQFGDAVALTATTAYVGVRNGGAKQQGCVCAFALPAPPPPPDDPPTDPPTTP